MHAMSANAVRHLKSAGAIAVVAALTTGCSYIDDLKAGDRGTWAITVVGAVVLVGIVAYERGKDSLGGEVDPNSSTASPDTIRREQEARTSYQKARSDRIGEEAAVRERQEQVEAAERAEQERQSAVMREELRQREAAEQAEHRRQQAERERIAAAVAAERATWMQQHPEPPKQARRVFVKTETVRVSDPVELPHAIHRCISQNRGGIFTAGLSPDPPQVTADGRGAAINFFREE